MEHLFSNLSEVRWDTASRTYGNSHCTLIGLFVDWWLRCDEKNTALDRCPSCNDLKGSEHSYADALLCQGDSPAGILEVEGTGHDETARKLEKFLNSLAADLKGIRFAIFAVYSTAPRGSGQVKQFADPSVGAVEAIVRDTSGQHPEKELFLLYLEKAVETRLSPRIRQRRSYYCGKLCRVHGRWFRGGQLHRDELFFESRVSA